MLERDYRGEYGENNTVWNLREECPRCHEIILVGTETQFSDGHCAVEIHEPKCVYCHTVLPTAQRTLELG